MGAPSVVRLSSGRLVLSHEYFTQSSYIPLPNVSVYTSDDGSQSWSFISNIAHTFCTTLFVHNNNIYAIGIDNELNGATVIHRSSDNAATWTYNGSTDPVVLFLEKYAGDVTPVVIANNILYHATEFYAPLYRWP